MNETYYLPIKSYKFENSVEIFTEKIFKKTELFVMFYRKWISYTVGGNIGTSYKKASHTTTTKATKIRKKVKNREIN